MPKAIERKERNFLRKAKFIRGITSPQDWDRWSGEVPHAKLGIAFVGRSNVGKSSLFNALFGPKTAHVSKTPGRTREINIFEFRIAPEQVFPFYAFDLPGYGFAEVSHAEKAKWESLIQNFFEKATDHVLILNIQDARHPISKVDQDFLDFMKLYKIKWDVIFNKIDKLKTQKERHALNSIKQELLKEVEGAGQVHFVSAETMEGIDQLESSLLSFLKSNTL